MQQPSPFQFENFTVKNVIQENTDTVTLELASSKKIFFSPGQFNMLYIFGLGEIPISVSGANKDCLVHTIRSVGAISDKLCRLKIGDVIGLRGAYGKGWPIEKSYKKNLLIIAGGIGLAPLKPVISQAIQSPDKFKSITIIYGSRSSKDQIFKKEINTWQKNKKINFISTVDQYSKDWKGRVGVVTNHLDNISLSKDTIAMTCGPEIMMLFVIKKLLLENVLEENIFLSMERNMKCGIGLCGHCQYGESFICKEGPVYNYKKIKKYLRIKEF